MAEGEGLLQVLVPDFGSTVLGSLEDQRTSGQYCDVHILVQGQVFKAHRAVLAASSLYFRDLFSSDIQPLDPPSVLELPSSVSPVCFGQILSFCYTGRLKVALQDQLVLMYTAGYLQIQNIVERGLELLLTSTSASPLCDSQTSADDLGLLEHSAPHRQQPSPDAGLSEDLLLAVSRIKQERAETPPPEEQGAGPRGGARSYLSAGVQSLLVHAGGRYSPASSPSQPAEEDLDEDYFNGSGLYQHLYPYGLGQLPEKWELPSALTPAALTSALTSGLSERRPCVLVGRDNMALPASLVSQIGYRCHPSLYAEADPGQKLELVVGSGVFMTRGQLMNCHLCAGVKHKVLLRRLLATFFDRNTLANSCGTGIRSSTNDPTRRPLDNRVLNTVKLYCQNFAPSFKESEMNVIAADMCTNARRVRKRWLPKIQALLPSAPTRPKYRTKASACFLPDPYKQKPMETDPAADTGHDSSSDASSTSSPQPPDQD